MSEPINLNPLNINGFNVMVDRIPIIQYTAQNIVLPDMTLDAVQVPNPFVVSHTPGDHLQFSEFSFDFIVDEDLVNYRILRNWMVGLGFPEDYEQFKNFQEDKGEEPKLGYTINKKKEKSDIQIVFLTNHKNPQVTFTLRDCFPTNLSGLTLNVTNNTSEPVIATCTMSVRDYIISK